MLAAIAVVAAVAGLFLIAYRLTDEDPDAQCPYCSARLDGRDSLFYSDHLLICHTDKFWWRDWRRINIE